MVAKREKLGLINGVGDDELGEEQMVGVMPGVVIALMVEGYYESLEHCGENSALKTKLEQVEHCSVSECHCIDNHVLLRPGSFTAARSPSCVCGHFSGQHQSCPEDVAPEVFQQLLEGMAAQVYPNMQNRNGEGHCKTTLNQIDTCVEPLCPCYDFNLSEQHTLFLRRCEYNIAGVSMLLRGVGIGFR